MVARKAEPKPGCPTPSKPGFETVQDAEMYAREIGRPEQRGYICPCGNYHLTSSKKRDRNGRYF